MRQLLYTDTDSIRSVLGISKKEMTDVQLVNRSLEKELVIDLSSWVPTHSAIANTVAQGTATEAEKSVIVALSLYSTYFCARLVVSSLQLAALQSVGDGKNDMNRFTTVDWDKLHDRMSERLMTYKKIVLDGLTVETTPSLSYSPFSVVSPAYDPVTGE